jgi:DNA-directed RNA polymerase subunit H
MAKKTTKRKPVRIIKKKVAKRKVAPKKSAAKKADDAPVQRQEWVVSKHNLVPKHQVLKEAEVEQLFATYTLSPQHLPVIFIDDPALAGLDAKMGDIVRITRSSPTAGTAIVYRRVAYE